MLSASRRAVWAAVVGVLAVVAWLHPAEAHAEAFSLDPRVCGRPNSAPGPVPNAWQVERLDPSSVWSQVDANGIPITGAGVSIAVIDTGAQYGASPYLSVPPRQAGQDATNQPSWELVNLVPDADNIQDNLNRGQGIECEHGTLVVSLINGQDLADDNSDFSGIAPNSRILAMRALASATDTEDQSALVDAINEAINRRVDIINISQAGADVPTLADAVARALDAGIVVVASAGNSGPNTQPNPFAYPAAYPGVISVGMTANTDAPHSLSQANPNLKVTVAAPGDSVVGLLPSDTSITRQEGESFADFVARYEKTGQYWSAETGTSFSAPQVTGVVALMIQYERARGNTLTPAEVKRRLEVTADPPAGAVPDPQLGYGTVNPNRAVFGPYPNVEVSASGQASSDAGPLQLAPPDDPTPMFVAIGVASLTALVMIGGVIVSAALPAMRRRRFAPAKPTDS